jgi:hypothetical protein
MSFKVVTVPSPRMKWLSADVRFDHDRPRGLENTPDVIEAHENGGAGDRTPPGNRTRSKGSAQHLFIEFVHAHLVELHARLERGVSELETEAVDRVQVDRDDLRRASLLACERVKAIVGADIEHSEAIERAGNSRVFNRKS